MTRIAGPIHSYTVSDAWFCCRAELPHSCDLCGRRFRNLPGLNGHMRLHGGYYKKVNY